MSASSKNSQRLSEKALRQGGFHWYRGDCLDFVEMIPDQSVQLIVTSPPYAIKKEYEETQSLTDLVSFQEELIESCVRILKPGGSICWQVGNFVDGEGGEKIPWDIMLFKMFRGHGLKMRNRIVWHYEHGMHARHFFSGRYEVVMWFTKGDDYLFNLDAVRVPQKQPQKRFYKGPRKGEVSSNPLGKNPGDVWKFTNVKNNHPEKIPGGHPCQFPLQLVDRLVLSMSKPGDIVFDPFGGVASTLVSAINNKRVGIGSEIEKSYHSLGLSRIKTAQRTKSSSPSRKKAPSTSSDASL